jgi:hypothetical protein
VVLLVLAAIVLQWPRVLAIPTVVVLVWAAIALLIRVAKLAI